MDVRVPEPIVDRADGTAPEHEALLADSVGLALLVVLETLNPAERLAFVLHDIFAVPFDEIAPIIDRSPEAARQLASRARRRVRAENPVPDADLDTQREVVDAFLAAAREGDFGRLVAVLDPDVVLRRDFGPLVALPKEVRGAEEVARQALIATQLGLLVKPALVNGAFGWVATRDGEPFSVGAYGTGREDRRDRHPRRPRAPPQARPDDPRQLNLALSSFAPEGTAVAVFIRPSSSRHARLARCTLQAAPAMQLPVFLILITAPVYVPRHLLRGWIETVSQINPATAILKAGRGLIAGNPFHVALAFTAAAGLAALLVIWARGERRRAEAAAG